MINRRIVSDEKQFEETFKSKLCVKVRVNKRREASHRHSKVHHKRKLNLYNYTVRKLFFYIYNTLYQ